MALYCSPITGNVDAYLCGMRQGGLKGLIYVANFGDINEISSTAGDKNMDTILMNIDPLTTLPYYWYQIAFRKNSAGLNNELVVGNNKYINQTITFQIDGLTAQSHTVLQEMADGEAVFIVTDYQGKVHVLGRIAGLETSAAASGTGTALDDLYGATVTFSSAEPEYSNFVLAGTTIEVSNGAGGVTVITL